MLVYLPGDPIGISQMVPLVKRGTGNDLIRFQSLYRAIAPVISHVMTSLWGGAATNPFSEFPNSCVFFAAAQEHAIQPGSVRKPNKQKWRPLLGEISLEL